MPFIGCNLLLSHLLYIKTVLQATSYEKTSTVSLCFPVAPGQRPSRGAQWLRQPRVTALSLGRAAWWGPGASEGSQARAPWYRQLWEGARGQEVEGRRRGSAFFVEGCIVTTHHLSLPRWELRGSTRIFLFNCFPPYSYITGKPAQMHENPCCIPDETRSMWPLSNTAAWLMLSSTASISFIFEESAGGGGDFSSVSKHFRLIMDIAGQTHLDAAVHSPVSHRLWSSIFSSSAIDIYITLPVKPTRMSDHMRIYTHPITEWYWHFPEGSYWRKTSCTWDHRVIIISALCGEEQAPYHSTNCRERQEEGRESVCARA